MTLRPVPILFTIPNFDTAGSGKALLTLAERLDRTQYEPHICCMHERGTFFATVRATGIPVHVVQYTSSMSNRIRGVAGCWHTRTFFRQFPLIHSFHYSDDYSEPLAARFAGSKWIYTKKNMSWGSRAWQLRTRLAHGVVTQNTDMMRLFFAGNRRAKLIPLGVDTIEFAPRPKAVHVCRELGLLNDEEVILSVANLVPVKGVEHLIDAFAAFAGTHPKTRLLIVGDDRSEYGAKLRRRAAMSEAAARITFTGKRSDIQDLQSVSRVFVQPTVATGEGAPISLLEAMASGILALGSDVAGIRDQLSDLPRQLFEPGNPVALARKLEWAFQLSTAEREQAVQQQFKTVQERYTLTESVAKHEAFYRQILRGSGNQSSQR